MPFNILGGQGQGRETVGAVPDGAGGRAPFLTCPSLQFSGERTPSIGTVAKNSVAAAGQFHLVAAQ